MTAAAWEQAYVTRFENSHFGDDAIGLFALGLKFGIDDLEAVGTEGIVEAATIRNATFRENRIPLRQLTKLPI